MNKRSTGLGHGGYQRAGLLIRTSKVSIFRDVQYCVYSLLTTGATPYLITLQLRGPIFPLPDSSEIFLDR